MEIIKEKKKGTNKGEHRRFMLFGLSVGIYAYEKSQQIIYYKIEESHNCNNSRSNVSRSCKFTSEIHERLIST